MRALVPAASFPSAMDAVRSNKQLGGSVTLFLERRGAPAGGTARGGKEGDKEGGAGGGGGQGAARAEAPPAQQSLFDSSLFDE
jgi:hypothetical protein